jgi:hypothetical protein
MYGTTSFVGYWYLLLTIYHYRTRGILEIVAEGRPTVGLVPLVFMSA